MYRVIIIWTLVTIVFYSIGMYLNVKKRLRYRLETAYA